MHIDSDSDMMIRILGICKCTHVHMYKYIYSAIPETNETHRTAVNASGVIKRIENVCWSFGNSVYFEDRTTWALR
jgi:hypothetical protein